MSTYEPAVVTGVGTVAPGRSTAVGERFDEPMPVAEAFALTDFDPVAELGPKAARFLDRSTAMTLVACGRALSDAGLSIGDGGANGVGVAVGTSAGSISGAYEFSRETYRSARPHLVNAALFPNSVLNRAAAQAAIHLGLRGMNSTLAGGRVSGLIALWHAELALRCGHVDAMVVGAVEELTAANAWTADAGWRAENDVVPGEAASFIVLERKESAVAGGRTPRAEVLAIELCGTDDLTSAVGYQQAVDAALAAAGVAAQDIAVVSVAGASRESEQSARAVLRERCPSATYYRAELSYGDCFSAMAAVQIADVLALLENGESTTALVLSADQDNGIGVLVLRASQP